MLAPGLKSTPFTPEEDRILLDYVDQNGTGNWAKITRLLPGRTDNNVLRRWKDLKKGEEVERYLDNSHIKRMTAHSHTGNRAEKDKSDLTVENFVEILPTEQKRRCPRKSRRRASEEDKSRNKHKILNQRPHDGELPATRRRITTRSQAHARTAGGRISLRQNIKKLHTVNPEFEEWQFSDSSPSSASDNSDEDY